MTAEDITELRNRRAGQEDGYYQHWTEALDTRAEPRSRLGLPRPYIRAFFALLGVVTVVLLIRNYDVIQSTLPDELHAVFSGEAEAGQSHIHLEADEAKRSAVVAAFKHAWLAYEHNAMGSDEYHPISKRGTNLTTAGGIGYTVIDALDTMQIMGLKAEYSRARYWVKHKLSFDRDGNYNTFETTIRVLGGLLSAYHLSNKDQLYLDKAVDLAERLIPAFDTKSGLPLSSVSLGLKQGLDMGAVSTAEAATLQLELKYLSFLTGRPEFWEKSEKVYEIIKKAKSRHGVVPIYMNAQTGKFTSSEIRLGSRGDSYYEYLLKQHVQTNYTETVYFEMYKNAMKSIHDLLLRKGVSRQHTLTIELLPERYSEDEKEVQQRIYAKQDHLVCFLGGSLMLGATTVHATTRPVSVPPRPGELTPLGERDWKTGVEIIETCMHTHETATGLSPEIVHWYTEEDGLERAPGRDWYIKGGSSFMPSYDARYILRPETVESLFIAYRLTGDQKYRDYGWRIFNSIEKYCKLANGGYASFLNVDDVRGAKDDKMETFFLSETLKYFYLLFSDETVIPLDKYVFNTEAHPLPIFNPHLPTGFS
ncbi:hypothetical protein AX16_002132 [Volvariella volvacea WC 439]|nr:hypothetical protein AX16_002132 [Volvariella volvacea WC 439]